MPKTLHYQPTSCRWHSPFSSPWRYYLINQFYTWVAVSSTQSLCIVPCARIGSVCKPTNYSIHMTYYHVFVIGCKFYNARNNTHFPMMNGAHQEFFQTVVPVDPYFRSSRSNLTLILLMWKIWWAPNNASKWQMGFISAFKGLIPSLSIPSPSVPFSSYST